MPLFSGEATKIPWWWSRIVMVSERIKNIQQASASDPEGMIAPKELWLTGREDELEDWFKDRSKQREEFNPLG